MKEMTAYQVVEAFQLAFCQEMFKQVEGRAFALKGGGCLRFFHGSRRLSEDIDFDVGRIRADTLEKNVQNVFQSVGFKNILRVVGIEEIKPTYPKKGDATQRWKCELVRDSGDLVHTKVEFSRRKDPDEIDYNTGEVLERFIEQYSVEKFKGQYYDLEDMLIQKIYALADSNRWAVRDGFDIHFLLEQGVTIPAELESGLLEKVMEKMETLSWENFKGEVLPYLEEEAYERFNSEKKYRRLLSRLETEFLKHMDREGFSG
ncbi:MAG: nucleotidyl transferase AbiEii/AbiGii toxin family protein [bacterium]